MRRPLAVGFLSVRREEVTLRFVNGDEAKDLDGVRSLFDRGCQLVVITLGEKGCRVVKAAASRYSEEDHLIEAVASPVADITRAGDAFAAGFLYNASFVAFGRGLAELGVEWITSAPQAVSKTAFDISHIVCYTIAKLERLGTGLVSFQARPRESG
jgi:sugar/nucleoside kinase (ribokinase family)